MDEDFAKNQTIHKDGFYRVLTEFLGLQPYITNNMVNFLKEMYNVHGTIMFSLKEFISDL
jgi:hypothetical protein